MKPILYTVTVVCSCFLTAAEAASILDYDTDASGKIEQKELEKILDDFSSLPITAVDENNDGRLSPAELCKYAQKQTEYRAMKKLDFEHYQKKEGLNAPYALNDIAKYVDLALKPDKKEPEKKFKGKLMLRENYDDTITIGSSGKKLSKASPALLSFSRNFNGKDIDQWVAKGSFMYPVTLADPTSWTVGKINELLFIPSLSFHHVENNDPSGDGEVDILTLRGGYQATVPHSTTRTSYYRANLAYATDFNFESGVTALELQWEPMLYASPIGSPYRVCDGNLIYRVRPIVHIEYGYVFDAGSKTALQESEDKDFGRLGLKLKADFWSDISYLKRFQLSLEASTYSKFTGVIDSGELLSAELTYRLDQEGNTALKLEYEKGEIPLSQDKVDVLTLGLGVKF